MSEQPFTRADGQNYYAWSVGPRARYPRLAQSLRVDVCVIGGGLTGLSAALELSERGFRVCVLESVQIGHGASGRNGGQLGSGQRRGVMELERRFGREQALRMWGLAEEAKAMVHQRIARYDIDCHYQAGNLLAITRERYVQAIEREGEHLARYYGYERLEMLSRGEMARTVASADYVAGQLDHGGGHLHPLRYVVGLARAACEAGVQLFEDTPATHIQWGTPTRVRTAEAEVTADYVLLCTNAYAEPRLEPRMVGAVLPIVNHVLATQPLDRAAMHEIIRNNACVHSTRFVVDYFRFSHDRRLIFGGGETYSAAPPLERKQFVRRHMLRVFPQLQALRIDFAWSGWLAVSLNRLPVFGRLGRAGFYAHGFSGHGLALSQVAGRLLAEVVAGDAERFDVMTRIKHRNFPGGRWLRHPLMMAGMLWYGILDRL